MSAQTLALLAHRQGNSIQELSLNSYYSGNPDLDLQFPQLNALCLGDIRPATDFSSLANLLVSNRSSLSYLKLGIEGAIAKKLQQNDSSANSFILSYPEDLSSALSTAVRPVSSATRTSKWILNNGSEALLQSEHLHLIGYRFSPSFGKWPKYSMFDLDHLVHLTLESCRNSQALFSLAYDSDLERRPWHPKLRSFQLRVEQATSSFMTQLKRFLFCFTGLEDLQVLLKGRVSLIDTGCVTQHGHSLRTLVWDQRYRPIYDDDDQSHIYCSTRQVRFFEGICNGCPKLRELGVVISYLSFTSEYLVSIR